MPGYVLAGISFPHMREIVHA